MGGVAKPPEGIDEQIESERGLRVSLKVSSDILSRLEYQHPFLDRIGRVLAADFVTVDTGSGLVHIAPGHGEDDLWLGIKDRLPIFSTGVDHGRVSDESRLPGTLRH